MNDEEIKIEENNEPSLEKDEKDDSYKGMKKAYKAKLEEKDEEIHALNQKIGEIKNEVNDWKNKYYMAYADTQNLRNSLEKEHKDVIKYRAEGFIEKLLPVIDGFNMALQMEVKDESIKNYLVGFEFIYRQMVSAMESEGVSEITPKVGNKFDPNTMNAIDAVEDEGEENIIKQVYAVGIKLHDRIIRHANVVVTKKPRKEEEKEENKDTNTSSENNDANA